MKLSVLSISLIFAITGCSYNIIEISKYGADIGKKYLYFDKNVTGIVTGNIYHISKKKDEHTKIKVK